MVQGRLSALFLGIIFYPCFFTQYYIPLLAVFRNPALRQTHWDDMSVIAGFDLTPDAGTTFRKILKMDLMDDLEK